MHEMVKARQIVLPK